MNYMEIMPDEGRIIMTYFLAESPLRYSSIACIYEEIEEGIFRARLSVNSEWYHHSYRFQGETLTLTLREGFPDSLWEPISPDLLPAKYPLYHAKALERVEKNAATVYSAQYK